MNPLMNIAVLLAGKPKIVHSIAGRLRVNISGVRQFPDYAKKYADTFTAILERRAGVTSVSLCLITGNLLVVYDAKKTDEKSIMNWIAAAWSRSPTCSRLRTRTSTGGSTTSWAV